MFRRCNFGLPLLVIMVAALVLTPAAGAAFTASQIVTPSSPTFALWSAAEASSITVAGTTTGSTPGEEVDIDCFTASAVVPLATGVPVASNGSFYVLWVGLEKAVGHLCRLRAVPATTVPSEPSPFAGPLLATGRKLVETFVAGPSEGLPSGFRAEALGLSAGASALPIGRCGARGFLEDAALEETTATFECVGRLWRFDDYQHPGSSTRSQIQVDGVDALTPSSVNEQFGGNPKHFPAISFSASQDPTTGNAVIHDGEAFVTCSPTSCAPTGVRDERTIESTEDGHLITVTDRYSSTDGEPHALDLLPENTQAFGPAGAKNGAAIAYRFPGQATYATHQPGDEVTFADATPAAISVKVEGSPDGDQATGRGAIVFDRPASPAKFNLLEEARSGFELHQAATVPASGSTDFRTAYVQAYTAAEVESLTAKVESSFAPPSPPAPSSGSTSTTASNPPSTPPPTHRSPSIHVTGVKFDRAAGAALLLARVNGPGRITLSGKAIADAGSRSSAAGIVTLQVRAKGGARRRLADTGKATVRAKLSFQADEGGEARTATTLVLRRE
ncbi:MAG TPA: hypothetical protein VGO24_01575 [Solirubrobacterales bacterium]|nr:hypothetical protein [Solirubrobacterales bacterium]